MSDKKKPVFVFDERSYETGPSALPALKPMADHIGPDEASPRAVCLGDYVLASKFHDCDPLDPWRVGFVVRIIHTWNRDTRYIIGEANSTWSDFYEYRYCRKITPEQGKAWICQATKT